MKNILLSLILPCYNVEKYIVKCLDSLYNQDMPEIDYEVICVNDCSPDATSDIIMRYQKQHENLILINHEVNKKQGGARNTGLKAAKGKYIWFIDPDDYIRANCLKELLTQAEENKLDILFFNFEKVDEKGIFFEKNDFNFTNQVCCGKDIFLNRTEWWKNSNYCWARIVRKNLFVENNLFFYENFYHEDETFGVQCFLHADKIQFTPEVLYFYRQHLTSSLAVEKKWDSLAGRTKCAVEFYKIALKVDENYLKNEVFLWIAQSYTDSLFKSILYLSQKDRNKFYEKLKLIDDLPVLFPICNKRTKIALTSKFLMSVLHVVLMPIKKKNKN